MKHILSFLSAILLTILGGDLYAQKNSESDYNLKKAYEALNDEQDEAKALDLVNQQLKSTPDNVLALLLRARLLRKNEEFGLSLRDLNHALKVNKPKKTGVATSTLHWWKAYVYDGMDDPKHAAESYKAAYELGRKDNKENFQSISFDYAQALYNLGDYAGAEAVYREMLSQDETDQAAMVGIVRNMINREQYQEALALLDQCRKYDADYSEIYRFRMNAYDKMGEVVKAIDAGLDWLEKNEDARTDAILVVLKKRPNYAEASLKSRLKKTDNPFLWKAFLCEFYEETHRYAEAIRVLDEIEAEFGQYDQIDFHRSEYYSELGLHDKAIAEISRVIEKDADWMKLVGRGVYYCHSGDLDAAIADFTAAIEEAPKEDYPYCERGWCYELKGNWKKALKDYNMAIELDGDFIYYYLKRGKVLLKEGNKAAADRDFEVILQKDTVVTDRSCRHYALHFLGKDKEAKEWMDGVIASNPENSGHYYDQACLYALMGRTDESVTALRTAFEKGYRSFDHIRMDDDMDPVRNLPAFKALIAEYEAIHAEYLKEFEMTVPEKEDVVSGKDGSFSEIPIRRKPGGTFEIPCHINGLALQMIFDTGASDVTISSVEANFMLKNGYLSEKDIKGRRYYQVASGELSAGTVITLREVKVGEAVLKNVEASVVKSQQAPLLLGQSAMERFGTITIDNENNKLIIKH